MKRFAVYTRITTNYTGDTQDIIVLNVEAHTNGGAEHKLLDNYRTVTNALAFDMETEMVFAAPYFSTSKCFDIADFDRRNRAREKAIQACIDSELDDIETARAENRQLEERKTQLLSELQTVNDLIEGNNEYIVNVLTELKEFCRPFNMQPIHSEETVIGIA